MRLKQNFETEDDCKERSFEENLKIESGAKKKHNHVGDTSKWNLKECVIEVSNYPPGTSINFSALARKYLVNDENNLPIKNGGQIVKKVLEDNGIDLTAYKYQENMNRCRRRKLKFPGSDVSLPCEDTNENVVKNLKIKISSGEYSKGEEITPLTFRKISLSETGESIYTDIIVKGRKDTLLYIRKQMYEKHKLFLRKFSDIDYETFSREKIIFELKRINEYKHDIKDHETEVLLHRLKMFHHTRHLMMWHDGSTVSNHSHILMMVKCVYDPAIFYTNKEYRAHFHQNIDINTEVEKPFLYIFGRCPASDEQLKYIDTRSEDLEEMLIPVEGYTDKMRFFHGDGPACQFEAGQQKGKFIISNKNK